MDKEVTQVTVKEALDMLRGAVMIVYPMGLPPHDPIRAEFENTEDLSGKQVYMFYTLKGKLLVQILVSCLIDSLSDQRFKSKKSLRFFLRNILFGVLL